MMGESEHGAFYVVRKANMVAVYSNLRDCQAQVSFSVCDPAVTVYKGSSLSKQTEEYLASRGLKNAIYTIDVADVKEDTFGSLIPCQFQEIGKPSFWSPDLRKNYEEPRANIQPMSYNNVKLGFPLEAHPTSQSLSIPSCIEAQPVSSKPMLCVVEFDGVSKGNPGKAGAGVVLRTEDGRVISRICEGLGIVTNNFAEYRAVILGMKFAIKKGFKHVLVQGDSQLVCMQIQGHWQTKNANMIELCKQVNELREHFLTFKIRHVKRDLNADADTQANIAANLPGNRKVRFNCFLSVSIQCMFMEILTQLAKFMRCAVKGSNSCQNFVVYCPRTEIPEVC